MTTLLSEYGRQYLRTFGSFFLVFVFGLFAAPNLRSPLAISIACAIALVAAAFKALQALWPSLAIESHVPAPFGPMLDTGLTAFIGAIIVTTTGWLASPDYDLSWKAFVISLVGGAVAAAFRAVQGTLTKGDFPLPATGLPVRGTPELAPRRARPRSSASDYSRR